MTTGDDIVDWRDLREFAGVDLTQSHILSWHIEGEALIIDMDLFLLPGHPYYEAPRPAERVCIRPAKLEFHYCEPISVDGRADGESLADTVAGLGPGAVATLRRVENGDFEFGGAFGTVVIDAERPIVRMRSR